MTFDGAAAPLLYVSSTQINVAVPSGEPVSNSEGNPNFSLLQVSVNGVDGPPRVLPVLPSNPTLFADLSGTVCTAGGILYSTQFTDLALNADGTVNSCSHPAKPGTVISFLVNGLGVYFNGGTAASPWMPSQIPVAVTIGQWSAEVVKLSAVNPFVWQVDVIVPSAAAQNKLAQINVIMDMNFYHGAAAVGPLTVESVSSAPPGTPFALSVWIEP